METYAFLPREAVTAFLMGCPQCSTNNATSTLTVVGTSASAVNNLQSLPQLQLPPHPVGFFRDASVDEQWLASFACSTPVKCNVEEQCIGSPVPISTVADKENITQNGEQSVSVAEKNVTTVSNKRKRTMPLKCEVGQSCCVVAETICVEMDVMSGSVSNNSSTLKNTSNSSCTLGLTSSSSPSSLSAHADCSDVSRLSNNWWPKWKVSKSIGSRLNVSGGVVGSADLNGASGNVVQPLDLSSSPLLITSSALTTIRSSSSLSVVTDDLFYKRRRVRRRRIRPKRLNRSFLSRRDNNRENDDISSSDNESSNEVVSDNYSGDDDGIRSEIDEKRNSGNIDDRVFVSRELIGGVEMDEENNGPTSAKKKKIIGGKTTNDRRNNNNDDDYYNKTTVAATLNCCAGDSVSMIEKDAIEEKSMSTVNVQVEISKNNSAELDECQVSFINN